MTIDEFAELVEKVTGGLKTIEYLFEAYMVDTDKAYETNEYWTEDIEQTLSEYFGVTVTSWRFDISKYPDLFVFIYYREGK